MVFIALEPICDEIFDALTKVISYFGFTIGDHTASEIQCGSLASSHDSPACVGMRRWFAGQPKVCAVGFSLKLTMPHCTHNITGWKVLDLKRCLRTVIAQASSSLKGVHLPLEDVYRIVGRLIWIRCNSLVYIPNLGPLSYAQVTMVAQDLDSWIITRDSVIYHCLRRTLNFIRDDWPLVMPEIISLHNTFVIYCDQVCDFALNQCENNRPHGCDHHTSAGCNPLQMCWLVTDY